MKRKMRLFLRRYDEELFIFCGFVLLIVGAYTLHPSAAWFVAGTECLVYAVLLSRGKRK